MARLWSCGFELQSATALMEWDATTGSPTITTTTKRSGAAALRCNTSAATAYLQHRIKADGTAIAYVRFYLRIASAPSASTTICSLGDASTFNVNLRLETNRTLRCYNGTTAIGTASSAIPLDEWHMVEFGYDDAGSNTMVARLDGVQFSSATGADMGGWGQVRLGVQIAATADLYFDDFAVNDASGSFQTSFPGEGSIVHLYPSAAGDSNTWNNAVGGTAGTANNFTRVDEVPPDNATSYNERTTTTIKVDDYALPNSSLVGIGASDTISLVAVGVRGGATSATAATSRDVLLRIKGQASGTVVKSGTSQNRMNINGWTTHAAAVPRVHKLTTYVNPQDSAAWEPADIDTMQIGVENQISSTVVTRVTTIWALVEYVPAAAGEEHSGTGGTSATSAQTSQGSKSGSGSGPLAAPSAASSTGLAARAGTGAGSSLHSLATAGIASRSGSTVLAPVAVLATTGSTNRAGAGVLAVAGDSSASGMSGRSGSVTLEDLAILGTSGTKYGDGTATLAATGTVTGSGSQGFEPFGSGAMVFPDDVADLVAWWHADDLALSTDDPVSLLPDRIGSHDLAQATADRRPLYRATDGQFSKPAILFDGTNDFLDAPFHVELNPVAFTFFAKVSVLSNPSGVRGVMAARAFDGANMLGYLIYGGVADDTWQAWYGQTGTTEATSVDSTVTENAFSALAFRASATQGGTLFVDGVAGTTGANFTAPNTSSPLRIGAGASETANGDFFANMLLTEAFFYDRRLSDTEIADLVAYLEAQHESGDATSSSAASATGSGTSGRSGSASVSGTAQATAQGAKGAAGAGAIAGTSSLAGIGDGTETPSGTGSIGSVAASIATGVKGGLGTAVISLVAALTGSGHGDLEDTLAASTVGDNTATADLPNARSSTQVGGTLATTYADRTANP